MVIVALDPAPAGAASTSIVASIAAMSKVRIADPPPRLFHGSSAGSRLCTSADARKALRLSTDCRKEETMFDHVGLNVRDYAASRAFYERALAPLGYGVVTAFDEWKAVGFGKGGKPSFWVAPREPDTT